MELVTGIVNPVVESLMGGVKKQLGFCFYSTNNDSDMRARIRQLNDTAHDIKARKETNDANNLDVPHRVTDWLAEVGKICEEAGNIPSGGIGCFNMKTRYKAGKKSSDIIKKIGDIEDEQSRITWSNEQRPLGRVHSTGASTSEPVAAADDDDCTQYGIKSRYLIFKEALKSLDPKTVRTQRIALCGMGGVGKTTMMEQLKKVAEDKKMFDWIVKVVIGKSENLIAIQQTIAEYIGQPLTETQKDTRAERLRKRFLGMSEDGKKNILVILDDLWEEVDLKDIGLVSPLRNGFKLLLTSRDDRVCSQLGVETSCIFKLAVLEESEAKNLFWEIAGRVSDGDSDHDICTIGEDIVNRCDGLPIAIKTIASTLKDNNIKDEWKDALSRLQNKKFPILDQIFKISYDNLKDDDEKATFLLSGLFLDDNNIGTEDLMRYGWGLKLFQNVNSITTARHRVNTCVNNLIRSNLLIKSDDKGCVKMHDLVRDFILSNFSNVKQASLVNGDDISEQLTKESYERILLKCTGMCEFPSDFNHPNLVLLKLLDGDMRRTFPEDFYDRMEKLEVVAYDRICQPLLPRYSTTLRTLCLRSCSLVDDISFIGDLINLEVLSFAFCGISKLPSAVGNLKKLKLLDLTECVDLRIDDGVFQKLEKLRELYMRAGRWKGPIRFTEDSCEGLKMLSSKLIALDVEFSGRIIQPKNVSFEKLERFRIAMGCQFEFLEKCVYAYENTLKLVVSCKEVLECKINELFEKTEKLHLSVNEMSSLEQISRYPSQHSFCNLRDLEVIKCDNLTSIFPVNVASSLTKLESLTVSHCPVLESLVQGENSEAKVIKFHKLKYLRLDELPMFVSLCNTDQVMELPQLVELILTGLPNVTSIFSENNEISATRQPLLNKKSIFLYLKVRLWIVIPNLEKLKIYSMEKLKEIRWCENTTSISEEDVNNIFMLREIELRMCDSLVNIFPCNPMRLVSHLAVINGQKQQSLSLFHNLTRIHLETCKSIKYLFSPLLATHLPNLKNVGIQQCNGMEEVVLKRDDDEDEQMTAPTTTTLFPHLDQLELTSLPSLKHVGGGGVAKSTNDDINDQLKPLSLFPNLTRIHLVQCESIKYLFSPLMATHLPNLKNIHIEYCDGMEEVVSNRDDNEDEQMTAPITTTLFPHLDQLELRYLPSLKHVGGGGVAKGTNNDINDQLKYSQVPVVCRSLCQYSREITVTNCPAMSHVFPSYVVRQFLMVERLVIYRCIIMKEVFATSDIDNSGGLSGNFEERSGGTDTALAIPRLTSSTAHKLSNLKTMKIWNCDSLEHIFTFSTLESLTKLEEISIRTCEAMKVIVREENGEPTVASKAVVFPRLKSIELANLPNLEGFFLGMSEFKYPSLNTLVIQGCPKLENFNKGRVAAPQLKAIMTGLGLIEVGEQDINSFIITKSQEGLHFAEEESSD